MYSDRQDLFCSTWTNENVGRIKNQTDANDIEVIERYSVVIEHSQSYVCANGDVDEIDNKGSDIKFRHVVLFGVMTRAYTHSR